MGHDDKPHVGFPETSLHQHAETLVSNGFKVVVVEQMETPKELEQRNKLVTKDSTKEKAVRREICEVYSVGTVLHEKMLPPESQLLLSFVYNNRQNEFGFSFCDVSTCRLWVGISKCETVANEKSNGCMEKIQLVNENDESLNEKGSMSFFKSFFSTTQSLKSLLHQICAVEVVVNQSNVPSEAMKILKLVRGPTDDHY